MSSTPFLKPMTACPPELPHRIVRVAGGFPAYVSPEDYDLVSRYSWHADFSKQTYYLRTKNPRATYLHRLICGDNGNKVVDHIDGRGYNCLRSNLRWVSLSQNRRNTHACEFVGVRRESDSWWYYDTGLKAFMPSGSSSACDAALQHDLSRTACGLSRVNFPSVFLGSTMADLDRIGRYYRDLCDPP